MIVNVIMIHNQNKNSPIDTILWQLFIQTLKHEESFVG